MSSFVHYSHYLKALISFEDSWCRFIIELDPDCYMGLRMVSCLLACLGGGSSAYLGRLSRALEYSIAVLRQSFQQIQLLALDFAFSFT